MLPCEKGIKEVAEGGAGLHWKENMRHPLAADCKAHPQVV